RITGSNVAVSGSLIRILPRLRSADALEMAIGALKSYGFVPPESEELLVRLFRLYLPKRTPTPTSRPEGTRASTPTSSPRPTATSAPEPTATTAPVPSATRTPLPSSTFTPTAFPTSTSTRTPLPSPTRTPTSTPLVVKTNNVDISKIHSVTYWHSIGNPQND